MLKAEQIPDKAVEAAVKAWKKDTQSFRPNAETIAAAINAWPGMTQVGGVAQSRMHWGTRPCIILPLPQEARDE